ncbi:MAG: molybdopterin-dependent oxidoreductase, partial [Dehalococcoidia bacterium]
MSVETRKSFCRMCHAFCAVDVDVDTARNTVLAVRGDKTNPIFGGYTCIKGRNLPEQHNHPDRLRSALKRLPDGTFQAISSEQAMDEVAAKLRAIIDRDGPRAVATYNGTYAYLYGGLLQIAGAWHKGIGSPSLYNSASIDQPGKVVAMMRHGIWAGGAQSWDSSDVHIMIGENPVVSMYAGGLNFPAYNPWKRLNDAKKRGLKLIVIDPRVSDVAKRADLHLQVKPGEDPALLAGIIHVILEEGLYDGDFCQAYVEGLEDLRDAVHDFTPEYVEERAGVPAQHVVQAARMFAEAKRGTASSGTGVSMAPRSNLSEQLVTTLNTICGRYLREGEAVPNPGTLTPLAQRFAGVMAGTGVPALGERSRVREGVGAYMPGGDIPTTVLADEILTPGEGQVKALISIAGNPVSAWPDQLKTIAALKALELNVTVDIKMSATAKLCDYVFAGKLGLERPDVTLLPDQWFPEPYAQYAAAAVEAEGDVIEEWELFWGLAKRLGTDVVLAGGPMPMDRKLTTDEYLDLVCAGSRVPLDEVRKHPGGAIFPVEAKVQPRRGESAARLRAGEPELIAELREVRAEALTGHGGYAPDDRFSHRLISRRTREINNSSGRDLTEVREKIGTTNYAYMNPIDLAELGVGPGDLVTITSDRASILGVVASTADVPTGVISMSHSWGDTPEHDHLVRTIGSSTNRLVNLDKHHEKYTGMSWQSAIPVNIAPAKEP